MKLYMFRTIPLSIARSFHCTLNNGVIQVCRQLSSRFRMEANLFWHETLHVSDSSSVHHQEFIHCTLSNGICPEGL